MPSTQSKRDLVLKSTVAANTVATLNMTMEANFDAPAAEITYEDASDGDDEERTKYKLVFSTAAGGRIGCVTLRLIGNVEPADKSVTISEDVARYTFNPTARQISVALIQSPAASFERVWKQNARDAGRNEVVDDIAKLDVRVAAESGYSVSQMVRSTGTNELVLLYEWSTPATGAVVSGSVTLSSSLTAGAGYTLGAIRLTDTNPSPLTVARIR